MHVTLRQLRAFTAVLETGSFSAASQTMHLSQAAVSGLVKGLEEGVGARLLDRHTRRVSPTALGAAFAPMARRVLADLDEALDNLVNLKELRRGLVRVAAPEPLSCTVLPELIACYNRTHPGVDVRFEDVPIERVLESLHNGSADVGFGVDNALVEAPIESHALWAEPLAVALRPDDPLAAGLRVTWKDLRDRPLVNYMPDFATDVLSRVPPRNHPRTVLRVHRIGTALSTLRARPGVIICPQLASALVLGFGLKMLPLQQPAVSRGIALLVRGRATYSPAVQSFIDFTRDFAKSWTSGNASAPMGSGNSRNAC